ncbi:MAG: sigma-70 family RNA polymerase sigma factor [Pirellulales bacterium]|nr:sigma-70 family RNA polymerase sigma factor [Pirellulales bacterium]
MNDPGKTTDYVRLWTTHGQQVYAYILSLVANRADAEELFQDVSMTLWMKFDQFVPGTEFRAWAYRVAFNKVRSFQQLRQHRTLLCTSEALEMVDHVVLSGTKQLDAQRDALAGCLEKLHPRDRDLIDRRYQQGAPPKTVAQQVGRSVAAVYKALTRIHDTLFDCIRKATAAEGTP